MTDLPTHVREHLRTRFPNLSPQNAAKIAEKIAAEVAAGPGAWMPDADQVAGLAAKVQEANPKWFAKVPSIAQLTAHLAAKRKITSPTDRLKLHREIEALSDDERLAALGEEKIETAQESGPKDAHTSCASSANKMDRERADELAANFDALSPVARLALLRAGTAPKSDTAAAVKAAGRELRPTERLNVARGC
jgi:hypothetical protein